MTLYTIPEDKLLNTPENVLVALAAYNLMVLDIDFAEKSAPEHVEMQYEKLLAKVKA